MGEKNDYIRPFGEWLNKRLSEEENQDIRLLNKKLDEFREKRNEKGYDVNKAIDEIIPYMNSFVHLMFLAMKIGGGYSVERDFNLTDTEQNYNIVSKDGEPLDLIGACIDLTLDKYLLPDKEKEGKIQPVKEKLKNIVSPRNKLVKYAAKPRDKDLIKADTEEVFRWDIAVSRENAPKKVTTSFACSYIGNDRIKLQGHKVIDPYDTTIIDAVSSYYQEKGKNTLITPNAIYRAITGQQDGECAGDVQSEMIWKSLNKMANTKVKIDYTDEARLYGNSATESFIIESSVLSFRKITAKIEGTLYEGIVLNEEPPFLSYAKVSNQIASIPCELFAVKTLGSDGKYKKVRTSKNRIILVNFLLRRIEDMKRSKINRTINYEKMFQELILEDNEPFSPKEERSMKEFIPTALEYWKHKGHIAGYSEQKKGNKVTGIKIDL